MTKDEALKIALASMLGRNCNFHTEAISAVREALAQPECNHEEKIPMLACVKCAALCGTPAQPEQEPTAVAVIGNWGRVEWLDGVYPQLGDRMYSAPFRRKPWVGLTHEHLADCILKSRGNEVTTWKLIESKLKELNT